MRDKVIAALDVAWLIGLVVFAFTWSTVVLVGTGVLMAVAASTGWQDRKDLRLRASWRYRTEPRVDQAAHWSPAYWGTLTLAFVLLSITGYRVAPAQDGSLPGNLFMTLAVLTTFGWWRSRRRHSVAVPPTSRDRR